MYTNTYTSGIPNKTGFYWGCVEDSTGVCSVESIKKDGKRFYLMYFNLDGVVLEYYQFFGYSVVYVDFSKLAEFKFSPTLTP